MLRWFQALLPREDRFFPLFNRHAEIVLAGAEALRRLLDGGDGVAGEAHRVMDLETQADAVARDVLRAVRRTFITPFDRGDIKDLIGTLDDTIDQMQKTAKAALLFEVRSFEPEMKEMGDQILRSARLAVRGVSMLDSLQEKSLELNAITEEMIRLEDESDTANDKGIKNLFLRHRGGNTMEYIVGVELYDHLEKVMDRFEDVANRISGIMIESV